MILNKSIYFKVQTKVNSCSIMDRSAFCGCKGVRTCLLCEQKFNLKRSEENITQRIKSLDSFTYCIYCDKVYPGLDAYEYLVHPNHTGVAHDKIDGIFVLPDFINEEEESKLIKFLDSIPWDISQSGRRKQNFGPSCNFKKRKLKIGSFNGFPAETEFVQEKFKSVEILRDFQTIEQCSLEYDRTRGASIDPHIDDCWIWGERIVTVNLLSDSVLVLTKYKGDNSRYNLDLIENRNENIEDICIRIPMPKRSLIVLHSDARYSWEHCVLRNDIEKRRVCLAYREFTKPYLPGGELESKGNAITEISQHFFTTKN